VGGSTVYVLAFEEGAFSQDGELDLWQDFCDLIGLPSGESTLGWNKKGDECCNKVDNDGHGSGGGSTEDGATVEGGCGGGGGRDKRKRGGLRREVFSLWRPSDDIGGDTTTSTSGGSGRDNHTTGTNPPKNNALPSSLLSSFFGGNTTNNNQGGGGANVSIEASSTGIEDHSRVGFMQQLLHHMGNEFQNCFRVFLEEILGDGRIFNSHASLRKVKEARADSWAMLMSSTLQKQQDKQKVTEENDKGGEEVPNEEQNEEQNEDIDKIIESETTKIAKNKITNTNNAPSRQEKNQRAIRPTLAFEISLPYKSTSMEVTSLEWNADGTALSIIQRRKGSAPPAATATTTTTSSSNHNHLHHHNVTTLGSPGGIFLSRTGQFVSTNNNNNNNSSNTNNSNSNNNKKKNQTNRAVVSNPSLSGNTAVSFWTIPEWLLVDYEDAASLFYGGGILGGGGSGSGTNDDHDNNHNSHHPHRYEEDGIVVRAPVNGAGECGWEVEDDEENTALFPMWEWYLARHVFKDEVSVGRMNRRNGGEGPYGIGFTGDSGASNDRYGRILMKNMMEVQAYPMELVTQTIGGSASGTGGRHGKKGGSRSIRGGGGQTDNASVMMNGDVTCLFWEETTPTIEDEEREEKRREEALRCSLFGIGDPILDKCNDQTQDDKGKNSIKNQFRNKVAMSASKWVVMGTSKGQVILHNCAASYLSHQSRKMNSQPGANLVTSICPPHARTITIPLRHKKRVTCGAWLDNLLVFGSVGSGSLTVVSTFNKINQAETLASVIKNKAAEELFQERNVKVLGNIVLPGGRDAFSIQIGSIEDDFNGSTILSVNCEGKCLLFYTFPKIQNDENSNTQASITSPAMEISFSLNSTSSTSSSSSTSGEDIHNPLLPLKEGSGALQQLPKGGNSGTTCGNILEHYVIPNTSLVLIAFSAGYFALVDWANGTILSDAEVASHHVLQHRSKASLVSSAAANLSVVGRGDTTDHFLLDVAFHAPTSTFACITQSGHIVVFQIRLMDNNNVGTQTATDGDTNNNSTTINTSNIINTNTDPKTDNSNTNNTNDLSCTTGLVISTKTHTRPPNKTNKSGGPSSLTSSTTGGSRTENTGGGGGGTTCRVDPSSSNMSGSTIDTLCSRKIDRTPGLPSDGRKGSLINFSADGECVSVSFGDESVSLYAIRYDEAELDREKLRLEESIYVGKDQLLLVFMFLTCAIIAWLWNQSQNI